MRKDADSGLAVRTLSPHGLIALALLTGGAVSAAHADTYDLSANITSFRSWIDPGNVSRNVSVNGTVLTDSGTSGGMDGGVAYDWSNTVNLATGTQAISFGYDQTISPTFRENAFSVAPASSTVVTTPGVNFDLASLSFTNGQFFKEAEVGLTFTAHEEQTGADFTFTDTALITSTSSPYIANPTTVCPDSATNPRHFDPTAEADYFSLENNPGFGSIRVYEAVAQPCNNPGVTGGGVLSAHIGSLDPVGFSSVFGAAYADTSTTDTPSGISPIPTTSAPEMDPTSAVSGLTLLLGGFLVLRGRRESRWVAVRA